MQYSLVAKLFVYFPSPQHLSALHQQAEVVIEFTAEKFFRNNPMKILPDENIDVRFKKYFRELYEVYTIQMQIKAGLPFNKSVSVTASFNG